MTFMATLKTWRRQRLADRVVANGKALQAMQVERSSIDGTHEHTQVDAVYLDARIQNLERRRKRLLNRIRESF